MLMILGDDHHRQQIGLGINAGADRYLPAPPIDVVRQACPGDSFGNSRQRGLLI